MVAFAVEWEKKNKLGDPLCFYLSHDGLQWMYEWFYLLKAVFHWLVISLIRFCEFKGRDNFMPGDKKEQDKKLK